MRNHIVKDYALLGLQNQFVAKIFRGFDENYTLFYRYDEVDAPKIYPNEKSAYFDYCFQYIMFVGFKARIFDSS